MSIEQHNEISKLSPEIEEKLAGIQSNPTDPRLPEYCERGTARRIIESHPEFSSEEINQTISLFKQVAKLQGAVLEQRPRTFR